MARPGASSYYMVQEKPIGLAHAFILGREFVGNDRVALILGDNIFYGHGLSAELAHARHARTARRRSPITLMIRASTASSNWMKSDRTSRHHRKASGFHIQLGGHRSLFYDNAVLDIAANFIHRPVESLKIPVKRGVYLELQKLHVIKLVCGYAWLDTGTHDALLEASDFVLLDPTSARVTRRLPGGDRLHQRVITTDQLGALAARYGKSDYGRYLQRLYREHDEW